MSGISVPVMDKVVSIEIDARRITSDMSFMYFQLERLTYYL
jgi:hypothetical protein